MNRIEKKFIELKAQNKVGLITFITSGDPDQQTSLDILKALPSQGADIIELGMPFSDPMADGPIIQEASKRAIAAGTTVNSALKMVASFRNTDLNTPLILMGYYNPIYAYGTDLFVEKAKESGVDGLIVVDLPPEEDEELRKPCQKAGLRLIRLVTPTTNEDRLLKIISEAEGFLYYVSIAGITGTSAPDMGDIDSHINIIRQVSNLPIAIGFGIKTPNDAANMAKYADAVVVGSAIVKNIADSHSTAQALKNVGENVKSLSKALA